MLSGSIKKYPEERRTTTYSYPSYYEGMYGTYDNDDVYSTSSSLSEQYKELQNAKNEAIKHGFTLKKRICITTTGSTGVIAEYAYTLRDGCDILGNYTPIGVIRDTDSSRTVTFYSETELELI